MKNSEELIKTYQDKDHDLLMEIRNGKFLGESKQPTAEFYTFVNEFEAKLQ